MRTPLVVVTGVAPVAIDSVMLSLGWDLPRAVSVRHTIDPLSQVLTRTVSDARGVVERHEVHLDHACVGCALREDIVPTIERLARDGRWDAIVSGLPTATEAAQVAGAVATEARLARHLRLSSVVAAVSADDVVRDLLSDDLLAERGVHTGPDDDRGVGEVACAQVEQADVVVLDAEPGPEATDLVQALARPGVPVHVGADRLDAQGLASHRHQRSVGLAWSSPELDADPPPHAGDHAWRLTLSSPRALHPDRLLDEIERLGTGPFRSRGSFWLPTRPGDLLEWSGAGGQLSIGGYCPWGRRAPVTRLVFTGLGEPPADLTAAFEHVLLTPGEARLGPHAWDVPEDGLEPWLGEIRDVA